MRDESVIAAKARAVRRAELRAIAAENGRKLPEFYVNDLRAQFAHDELAEQRIVDMNRAASPLQLLMNC